MPKVELDIQAVKIADPVPKDYARARDGYDNAIAYCYAFSGGNTPAKDGTVRVTKKNNLTKINVELSANSNQTFDILTAFYKYTPMAGVTVEVAKPNKLQIVNAATHLGTCNYTVIAVPQNGTKIFILCDPMIENSWENLLLKKKKKTIAKKKSASKKPVKKKAPPKAAGKKAARKVARKR